MPCRIQHPASRHLHQLAHHYLIRPAQFPFANADDLQILRCQLTFHLHQRAFSISIYIFTPLNRLQDACWPIDEFIKILEFVYSFFMGPGPNVWPQCHEEFSGTSTVSIMQEFYINVLLSNLASLIKNEADNNLQVPAESANKHRYQSNRSFIIGCFKGLLPKILCTILEMACIDQLYTEALRTKGKVVPDRSCPRQKYKLKGRVHHNNKKVAY